MIGYGRDLSSSTKWKKSVIVKFTVNNFTVKPNCVIQIAESKAGFTTTPDLIDEYLYLTNQFRQSGYRFVKWIVLLVFTGIPYCCQNHQGLRLASSRSV